MPDASSGDRETFEYLWAVVHLYISSRLGLPEVAGDLTQETLLRFFQRESASPVEHVVEFLFGIARHCAFSHLSSKRMQAKLEQLAGVPELTMGNYKTGPEDVAILTDVLAKLPDALLELTSRQQKILCSIHEEGLTVQATAARLKISYATCEKDLKNARRDLQQMLGLTEPDKAGVRRRWAFSTEGGAT